MKNDYRIYFETGRYETISGNSFIEAFFERGYRAGHLECVYWVVRESSEKRPAFKYTQSDLMRLHWELLSIEYMKEHINDHIVLGSGFDRKTVIEQLELIIHSF
jgi:hypothetical protein